MFSLFFAAASAIAALLTQVSHPAPPPVHHQAQASPRGAPSQPPSTPSYTGEPSNGSGAGAACTTVQGYYPAGLPGHRDSSGFCVAG
jgi:hypothetical protein